MSIFFTTRDKVLAETILLRPESQFMCKPSGIGCASKLESVVFILLGLQGLNIAVFWQFMSLGTDFGSGKFVLHMVCLLSYAALMGFVIPAVLVFSRDVPSFDSKSPRATLELNPAGLKWTCDLLTDSHKLKLSQEATNLLPWQSIAAICYGYPAFLPFSKCRLVYDGKHARKSKAKALYIFEKPEGDRPARVFRILADEFSRDQRCKLLTSFKKWAAHVEIGPDVYEALTGEPALTQDKGYTELWLQLLESSSKARKGDHLSVGDRLRGGTYTVVQRMDTGGQANLYVVNVAPGRIAGDDLVFKSASEATPKSAVLKEFIPPLYASDGSLVQALAAFEQEVTLLAKLDHPNIVKMIDSFVEGGRAYLVLEHVKGVSLRRHVQKEGPLSPDRVTAAARDISLALQYLHKMSPAVVHRDLSPDNILLTDDGGIKVIDFSVAMCGQAEHCGEVVGKQAYISPEQFRGACLTASDIYSLGATLNYLLTGFDPVPISVSHPAQVCPQVSAELDSLVARLTALELGNRYASAGEVLDALSKLGEPGAKIVLPAQSDAVLHSLERNS